jgi:hypothetical protein
MQFVLAALVGLAQQGTLKEFLRDADLPGAWIYDDIGAGFAKAKETGRPLLVVFR